MTTNLTSLESEADGSLLSVKLSNDAFLWLIRHRVFFSAGVFGLGDGPAGTVERLGNLLWLPDGWSGSAHDGWTFKPEQVPAIHSAALALLGALRFGIDRGRPWVCPQDRAHVSELQSTVDFLAACRGFKTS